MFGLLKLQTMLISLFSARIPTPAVFVRHDYNHLEKVQVENHGSLSYSVQMRNLDFSEKNKQFVYSDFDLGNIIATGAVNMLRPVQFQGVNVDNVISDTLKALNHAQQLDSKSV
jgi:hypothetical protein